VFIANSTLPFTVVLASLTELSALPAPVVILASVFPLSLFIACRIVSVQATVPAQDE
jgi:hypothetical protein